MTDPEVVSPTWKVRSPLGVFIVTSQAVSIPLALVFGEVKDVLIALFVPFYGVALALFPVFELFA